MFKPYSNMDKNNQTAGKTAIQKFDYEGSPISFAKGESVMVNATQMAKKFGKLAKDWLRTQQSKEFLNTLSAVRQISLTDLVVINQGGSKQQGTWMHEDVAIEFARWLSPKFAIWCNDRIKELAKGGYVAAKADESPELVMARALKLADDTIRRQQAEIGEREATIESQQGLIHHQDEVISDQNEQIRRLVPLANYARTAIENGTATYTMTDTAAFLGFARVADFLDWCVSQGILYRLNGRWMPTPDYLGLGYFTTRVYRRVVSATHMEEYYYTVVTEAGRMMLFDRHDAWTTPPPPRRLRQADTVPATVIEEGGAL